MTEAGFRPDPGGVFASDAHRRVLGHLPLPGEDGLSPGDLLARMHPDQGTDLDWDTLTILLTELTEAGFAVEAGGDFAQSEEGHEKLTGPALTKTEVVEGETVLVEEPPLEGEALAAAERANAQMVKDDEAAEHQAAENRVQAAKDELAAAEAALAEEGS